MKKMLLCFSALVFLAGCEGRVGLVKNGVMEFNKTISVGDALDNWSSCADREWESFETSNGIQVVQFICRHDFSKFTGRVKDSLSEREQYLAKNVDFASVFQTFQFTINKDDTFQIDNVQLGYEWADGKVFEDPQDILASLESAYDDERLFDEARFTGGAGDNLLASGFSYRMGLLKKRAQ